MQHEKLNSKGEYVDFYGFSVISMCKIGPQLEQLYDIFSRSILANYFKPLPLDSYHMTVYNIWCQRENFFPYQYTTDGKEPECNIEAMTKVMKPALDKMAQQLGKISNLDEMKLCSFKLKKSGKSTLNVLGISVELADYSQAGEITKLREWLGKNFDKSDSALKFHVTLGYRYREILEDIGPACKELEDWIQKNLTDVTITKPEPMMFTSMEKFIPYTNLYH